MRTGKQDNPRKSQIEALAAFFRVPVSYFFEDDEETARLHARLELLAAMRNNDVERIALRAADLRERGAPVQHDRRNVGEGFDIVDDRRQPEQSVLRGKRRLETRLAAAQMPLPLRG